MGITASRKPKHSATPSAGQVERKIKNLSLTHLDGSTQTAFHIQDLDGALPFDAGFWGFLSLFAILKSLQTGVFILSFWSRVCVLKHTEFGSWWVTTPPEQGATT